MDETEGIRRQELAQQQAEGVQQREALVAKYGLVLDAKELMVEYEVLGFMAPYCTVRRRSDGQLGSFKFRHNPRYYYDFQADIGNGPA